MLVANRGEIAVRIIRTLTQMGIESVAVYSDADRYAPHVTAATYSARLGPAPAAESYLASELLLEAAARFGADAVHPGYGFVSEDAAFARACAAAGLAWIGPTPDQMEQFGRKDSARALARAAGVPLLAGTDVLRDADEAVAAAREIGYPVMLKSRAGGGGIGMQRCDREAELAAAFARVTRLAGLHFGDPACFLEQCVTPARHVEVQIFGDGAGTVVALGERDCSLQRRHQKLVEETPAPLLSPKTRKALAAAAIALGTACHYRSAGTVEFVLNPTTQAFAFLEVNTRLQVEHPVTEAVTGIDLVEWMVRLADGTLPALTDRSMSVRKRGVAIEVRLYAEDPANDFRPSAGVLTEWTPPASARVDTWIDRATEITPYYDPLLAKIIVHGTDRASAIGALQVALAQTRTAGIETNVDLLRTIAHEAEFGAGRVTTSLVEELNPERRAIDVLAAGAQTTVQEWPGRLGYWEAGVPPSGPMDDVAFRVANRLVGNRPGAAALECTMSGPTLQFAHDTVIALTGAVMDTDLDGEPVDWNTAIDVEAGQVLRLGAATDTGARAYLAVRDGIDVPEYLGSRATFVLGRFGGHAGRALAAGDVLHLGEPGTATGPRGRFAADDFTAPLPHDWRVQVLPGPHAAPDFFTDADIEMLHETDWEVHHHSDRTGVRLIGPAPEWARSDGGEAGLHPSNIHDNEYAIGTIDFTGDMPIILGPDGPSLGGFVCPATVAAVDRWKLGQLRPGDRVRFLSINHEQAVELLRPREDALTNGANAHENQRARRSSAIGAVLHSEPSEGERPALTIRRAGDRYVLAEIGENRLDLDLRVRVHAMQAALSIELADAAELAPGIRSLQVRYEPLVTDLDALLKCIIETERALPPVPELVIPSRLVHLPLAWDDSQTQLATERYQRTVRADAPWCPSNLEFIRRINGLDSIDDVRRIVFDARYLVLGLGDVYLGAPVATPLDPRHRLVTTKYNPARTWTPENAVGIGGAYLCIYGMEGPGGYQFVGRTVQIWSRWHSPRGFDAERPWLLRHFDQLRFFPVSEEELLDRRSDIEHGHGGVDIEATELRMADYHAFLGEHAEEINAFRTKREHAFGAERARWRAAGVAEHVDAFPTHDDTEDAPLPRRSGRGDVCPFGYHRTGARGRRRPGGRGPIGGHRRGNEDRGTDTCNRNGHRHRYPLRIRRHGSRRSDRGGDTAMSEAAPQETGMRGAYARIAALDDPAVIISMVDEEIAVARAAANQSSGGALAGMPVLVKDNIAVAGLPTGAGCPAFGTSPAAHSAAAVEALERAGAVVIGTTNMDQFATGLVGTRSPYGAPRNPCAPDHIPGGSSSGSAVAVARGIVALALGTDTAGSGRVPAACTNTVGLKPTRGRIATTGIVPAIAGLDCVSIHTRTVTDAWDAFVALAGPQPGARAPGALRIGRVAAATIGAECDRETSDAYERTCAAVGADLDVEMDAFFAAGSLLYGPFVAAFGAFIDDHPNDVDPIVAAVVQRGDAVTGAEVITAQTDLASYQLLTAAAFDTIDVLVVPTIPTLPTLAAVARDPIGANARLRRFTDFVNLLDCCAVAVPGAPRADGLPFGVSVIAPGGHDALAAEFAAHANGEPWDQPMPGGSARISVVGAHLEGLPLHHQLTDLGAALLSSTHTAPRYRLYALAGTIPPKPGLVPDASGTAIECEVYAIGEAALGRFVAGVASPLAIGPVELADGSVVPGFLATAGALDGATDITRHGGWRAYLADEMQQ